MPDGEGKGMPRTPLSGNGYPAINGAPEIGEPMTTVFDRKAACCGCGACATICPVNAIEMQPDEEGFLYPVIDEAACLDCGSCRDACPLHSENDPALHPEPRFYIARSRDEAVVRRSASGGAFTALSNVVLRRGGVVYGAVFDASLGVMHARAETPEQRDRMCGSKYVQSRAGDTYLRAREDLEQGREVLFTGTPCQLAGLQAALGRPYEKLICCDVICHSVSSPLMWQEYLRLLSEENGAAVTAVNFRDKTLGWQRASTFKGFGYRTGSGEVQFDDRYYRLFFGWKVIARPSCSICRYARVERCTDITIADYWGVEKYAPDWADYYGVSFLMTSTQKGESLLHDCAPELRFAQRDPAEQIAENHRLLGPMAIPAEERAAFWSDYRAHGFRAALGQMKI